MMRAIFAQDFNTSLSWEEQNASMTSRGLTYFDKHRGLMVTRDRWDKDAVQLYFQPRSVKGGHSSNDRNSFSINAHGRNWVRKSSGHDLQAIRQSVILVDGEGGNYAPSRIESFIDKDSYTQMISDATNSRRYGIEGDMTGNDLQFGQSPEKWHNLPYEDEAEWNTSQKAGFIPKPSRAFDHDFRTMTFIRGANPFIIVTDNIKKDDEEHDYRWQLQFPKDVQVHSTTTSFDFEDYIYDMIMRPETGNQSFLVRCLQNNGFTGIPSTFDTSHNLSNKLTVGSNSKNPYFKFLLFPHLQGEPLPITKWNITQDSLTVIFDDKTFEIAFIDHVDGATEVHLVNSDSLTLPTNNSEVTELNFDLGTASSPVLTNYNRVTTRSAGAFGWTNSDNLYTIDRKTDTGADDMTRDFIYASEPRTFETTVDNGDWKIAITFGDAKYMHDNMVVKAEEVIKLNNITTNINQFITREFITSVRDGKLSLEFSDAGGSDINWVITGISMIKLNDQTAFKTHTIPGVIQAEHYDYGGQDIAYYDTDVNNNGHRGRTDQSVDIQYTFDIDGGTNVGWTANGEWLEYTIESIAQGSYDIALRIASNNDWVKSLQVELDGVSLGTVDIPNTGGWQSWQTLTLSNVEIPAGSNKILRLDINGGRFNINKVTFTSSPGSIANGIYFMKKASSNLYIEANGVNAGTSSVVNNNDNSLKWTFRHMGNEVYEITSVNYPEGKLSTSKTAISNQQIVTADTIIGDRIKWTAQKVGDNYLFVSKHDITKAIDMWEGNNIVHLYRTSTTNSNQVIQLIPTHATRKGLSTAISIFPNPSTTGETNITGLTTASELSIISINGKETQYRVNTSSNGLIISGLSPGIYIVSTKDEKIRMIIQ